MRCAARAVWAQFELLLLQQRVLYVKSAAHTTQAKLRMIVPKQLVEQALVEVHDGVAGAHLGGMESLMKMKARFRKPGTTKRCIVITVLLISPTREHWKKNSNELEL